MHFHKWVVMAIRDSLTITIRRGIMRAMEISTAEGFKAMFLIHAGVIMGITSAVVAVTRLVVPNVVSAPNLSVMMAMHNGEKSMRRKG